MFPLPHLRLLFILLFITQGIIAQKKDSFKYKYECYALLIEANTVIKKEKDTMQYNILFDKIDSLILSENNHDFYVKYLALRGSILSGNGFVKEGLKYNLQAVDYGEKYLPVNASRTAVAHGNLGFTYLQMGEIDSFIAQTFISNNILLTNPKKNASNLLQTNLNLELHLDDKPDVLFSLTEQNDSLVHFLSELDYDVKAFYHLRKSKHAITDNNYRKSKYHIGKAIHYFHSATKSTKINLNMDIHNAIAMNALLLKDYREAIHNYKIYLDLVEADLFYSRHAYVYNQLSLCYVGINELDSALHCVYKAYDLIKKMDKESGKKMVPHHAIEILKLNYKKDGNYDMDVYHELDSMSEEILDLPIQYLEYAKIKSKVESDYEHFYYSILQSNIQKTESNIFKSYYVAKLAEYHFESNEIDIADSLFDEANYLNQVLPDKTNSLLYNANLIKTYVDYKYKILKHNYSKYSDAEILQRYDVIVQNLLSYIYENWDSADKDEMLGKVKFYCDEAIAFCYSKRNITETLIPYMKHALYFSDQSNSILYKYNKRKVYALNNSNFSKDKLLKLNYYKRKLDAYIYGKKSDIDKQAVLDIYAQYNALLHEAQISKSVFVETENFVDFSNHLDKIKNQYDEVFVFHTSGDDIYKFSVGSQEMTKLGMSKHQVLNEQKKLFRAMVDHQVVIYEESAYKLYQTFFETNLSEDLDELLIINAPELLPIPFESYVKSIRNKPFNELDYLISDYVITYNQGLSSDYDFKKNFDLSVPYIGLYSEQGNDLKYAKSEIESVNGLLNGEVYALDENKHLDLFERLKLAQVIHIATHSERDSSNAYSSQLIFGDSADVNLKYYEIMNLDINPNLLVLNACSTADGEYKIGEGKISMARAFNYAGAHNVLVNAWDVSDFSVMKIMESFFGFYINKKNVAEALQLSKKDYLENSDDLTGNPLYWAGTIFVSPSHLSTRQYLSSLVLGIFVFSMLLIGVAYYKSKN